MMGINGFGISFDNNFERKMLSKHLKDVEIVVGSDICVMFVLRFSKQTHSSVSLQHVVNFHFSVYVYVRRDFSRHQYPFEWYPVDSISISLVVNWVVKHTTMPMTLASIESEIKARKIRTNSKIILSVILTLYLLLQMDSIHAFIESDFHVLVCFSISIDATNYWSDCLVFFVLNSKIEVNICCVLPLTSFNSIFWLSIRSNSQQLKVISSIDTIASISRNMDSIAVGPVRRHVISCLISVLSV